MAKLSDNQLKAICEQEITSSTGWTQGELAEQRGEALDAYLGEPYGNEQEGRSQIVDRSVLDTVETVLPSIVRILMDVDNAVEFVPVGPEDEQAAEQETDVVTHVVWQLNEGFLNSYTFIKDGLLSKNGIMKVWYDDTPEEEREQYRNITELELGILEGEEGVEREIDEYEENPDGTINVTYLTTRKRGRVRIEPCPPEEVAVNRDANSPNIQKARFVSHRVKKTKAELVEEGYPRKKIEGLPTVDFADTEERLARNYLDDDEEWEQHDHWSMQTVYVTECYLRVDRDDDGIAELLKVTLAGYDTGSTLLDVEEVDMIPFVSFSPILLTHKFNGLSLADLVMDLQKIRTNLIRGIIDNQELANNQRTAVNEAVNLDDLLVSRPGGVVRTKGDTPPSNNIFPIPHQGVPAESYQLLEYLDEERKNRTGVSDLTAGLDSSALSNVNTGVAAMAFDAARMKIELIARICAEVGFKPLYLMVHSLMRKNLDADMVIRLRGEYVPVHPSDWRERKDLRVQVGIGLTSRERRLMAIDSVLESHAMLYQSPVGALVVNPLNTYFALTEKAEIMGLGPMAKKYYMDPRTVPPQPEKPDPQMMLAMEQIKALQMDSQVKNQRNQVEMAKIQSQERLRVMEYQAKEQELQLKAQIEELKANLTAMKAGSDEIKAMTQAETKEREMQLKARLDVMQAMLKDSQESNKLAMDQYKAELQTWTQLASQSAQITAQQAQAAESNAQSTQQGAQQASTLVKELQENLKEQMERFEKLFAEQSKPRQRKILRDEAGQIVALDDMPVTRDANGLIASIG